MHLSDVWVEIEAIPIASSMYDVLNVRDRQSVSHTIR
jgi:hypothetical protein